RNGGGTLLAHVTFTILEPSLGLPPSVITIVEDITEQRREEETRRLKAAILDSTGEAALATGMNGKLLYFNRAAEVLFGWDRASALGQSVLALTSADAPPKKAEEIMGR